MNLRSPVVAMFWEHWRLSRVEAAQRVGFALVLGAGALTLVRDGGEVMAFVILATIFCMFWFSIAKLNGGQFMDGYKPGFPLYLLYTRPVSTLEFVSVALLYDAISCLALYLGCAVVLGLAFGRPLPLFSVALWLTGFHFCYLAVQWSTRSRTIQWIGALVFSLVFFYLIKSNVSTRPLQIHFSIAENVLMALACVVSFVATVVGVSRQRSGNAVETVRREARVSGYPEWLINLFRFACPTSSATRAQIWFELKSSGLPILAIGVVASIIVALLFTISIPVPGLREYAIGLPVAFLPLILVFMGSNAFGIRRRQGRSYMSAFEAAMPYAVAPMAGLKILVRSGCMLIALVTVALAMWASSSLVSEWAGWTIDGKEVVPKLLQLRESVANTFGGQTGLAYLALGVITSITVIATVALCAAYPALRARYGRRPIYVVGMIPAVFFVMVLLTLAERSGLISKSTLVVTAQSIFWTVVAAMTLATLYLFWSGFRERALSAGYACGAVLIATVMVVACLPSDNVFMLLAPAIPPLIVCAAAPWSLGRVRHA